MDKLGNTGWENFIHQRAFDDGFHGNNSTTAKKQDTTGQGKFKNYSSDHEAQLWA